MSSSQSLSTDEILPSATRLVNLEGCFFFSLPFNLQRMKYYTFTEAERRHLPSPVTYWGMKNDAESRGFWCDPPPQSFWTWRFPTHRSCLLVAGKNYHSPRSQLRVLTGLVTSSSTAQPLSPFPSLFFSSFPSLSSPAWNPGTRGEASAASLLTRYEFQIKC